MLEPKGWKLESTEHNAVLGETRIYTRGKSNKLVVSAMPGAPYLQISVSHKGRHPKSRSKMDFVMKCFPPGEWIDFACSSGAHHWHYEEHESLAMTKEEIDALAAEHGLD